MALSSFGKILTVLDLFSVSRPVINVDIICEELGLSKPTSYRFTSRNWFLQTSCSVLVVHQVIIRWVQKLLYWTIFHVQLIL